MDNDLAASGQDKLRNRFPDRRIRNLWMPAPQWRQDLIGSVAAANEQSAHPQCIGKFRFDACGVRTADVLQM